MLRVFCAPNATILLVYIPAKIKMSFIRKNDFFCKIGIFCKSIAGPLSEAKTHWMVSCLNSWTNCTLYGVIPRSLCKIRLNDVNSRNVQLLRTTVNWCWWRFTHTFYHNINILGCTDCFWIFTLWFIDDDASFFQFFHEITYIRSWRCFSSSKIRTQFSHTFCNITMIFKVMSQYFPALFKRLHNHIRSTER